MILTRALLLGHDPTPAWVARVALLCPGESVSARDVLRATLDAVTPGVPYSARSALDVAAGVLLGRDAMGVPRAASEHLRDRYDAAAGPRCDGFVRHAHYDRWRRPWCDPCDDAPDLRWLAAAVAAVYAIEAWATGERESVVAYYVRAAWGWR
jgi:hypothetical protein